MNRQLLCASLLAVAACASTPPADWGKGGALVEIPRARYILGDLMVDVIPDGRILVNGDHELTIDRGGRLFDTDNEAVALLEPDGRVVGPDETPLGIVGVSHAARADEQYAWLSVAPSGEVIRYDDDGDRSAFGVWMGCNTTPRTQQVCTFVTHIVALKIRSYRSSGVGIGIGVGVGIGVGR